MGIHPREQGTNDRHIRALERVVEACHNTGKIPGFCANDPQDALRRAQAGFQFLTAGAESDFMIGGAKAGIREFQKYY